jgi:hypothetical protein
MSTGRGGAGNMRACQVEDRAYISDGPDDLPMSRMGGRECPSRPTGSREASTSFIYPQGCLDLLPLFRLFPPVEGAQGTCVHAM